jgi:hypothetical protein
MHYNVSRVCASLGHQLIEPAREYAARRAAPAAVEQRDAFARDGEVYRNAVRHRHREQYTRRGGDPPINPFDLHPAARRTHRHHLDAVDLVSQDHRRKAGKRMPQDTPAAHDLADRGIAPEAEVESPAGWVAATGDPGDQTELVSPGPEIEAWWDL